MRTRVSKISLFFFVLNYNYIFLRVIVFPYLYDDFGIDGYIWIAVLGISLCLLLFLIPKKVYEFPLLDHYETSKIKYFGNLLLAIRVVLGVMITGIIIKELFYKEMNPFFFILPILAVVLLISSGKPTDTIEISTIFSIIGVLCYIIYSFDSIPLDFSLLLRTEFHLPDFLFPFILLALFTDNSVLLLTNKEKLHFSKWTIIFGVFSCFFIFLAEYFILLLSSGEGLFSNHPWVGFLTLAIQPVSKYLGNFDFMYIIILLVACIFKFGFFSNIIRNSIKQTRNTKKWLIISILVLGLTTVGCYFLFIMDRSLMVDIVIGIIGLLIILFIWMMKEVYYVKKTKE